MSILEVVKINKKVKILISSCLVSCIFVSLPFRNREVKAIAGVDDAIMIAVLGTLAVGSVGACYGLEKSGVLEKTSNVIGDGLQEIGSGFKTVYNGIQFAKSTAAILPSFLNAYLDVEGTEIEEKYDIVSNSLDFPFHFNTQVAESGGDTKTGSVICSFTVNQDCNFNISCFGDDGISVNGGPYNSWNDFKKGDVLTYKECFRTWGSMYQNFINLYVNGSYVLQAYPGFTVDYSTLKQKYYLKVNSDYISNFTSPLYSSIAPTLNDVSNKPTSITLDKAKVEAISTDYAEQYPDDNNGDKKVNYSDLIPFVFDLLEKDLGDGTITPTNLSNSGLVSYVYENGDVEGKYPYSFNEGENNITVNQNVNIGSDISEGEKNGILNMLDNGLRSTTERLKSLGASLVGFNENIRGLFSFLPEDVTNLIFLGICLTVVFFVLGLRR